MPASSRSLDCRASPTLRPRPLPADYSAGALRNACGAFALHRIAPTVRRAPRAPSACPVDCSTGALRGTCPVRFPADCSADALRNTVPRPISVGCPAARLAARPCCTGGRLLGRPPSGSPHRLPKTHWPQRFPVATCVPGSPPGRSPSPVQCAISIACERAPQELSEAISRKFPGPQVTPQTGAGCPPASTRCPPRHPPVRPQARPPCPACGHRSAPPLPTRDEQSNPSCGLRHTTRTACLVHKRPQQ
jgi:hypothetical protein